MESVERILCHLVFTCFRKRVQQYRRMSRLHWWLWALPFLIHRKQAAPRLSYPQLLSAIHKGFDSLVDRKGKYHSPGLHKARPLNFGGRHMELFLLLSSHFSPKKEGFVNNKNVTGLDCNLGILEHGQFCTETPPFQVIEDQAWCNFKNCAKEQI